jgi:hypothetical protein
VASSGASAAASAGVVAGVLAAGAVGRMGAGRASRPLAAGGVSSRKPSASSSAGAPLSAAEDAAGTPVAGGPGRALAGGASARVAGAVAAGDSGGTLGGVSAVGHLLPADAAGVVAVMPDATVRVALDASGRVTTGDPCSSAAARDAWAAPVAAALAPGWLRFGSALCLRPLRPLRDWMPCRAAPRFGSALRLGRLRGWLRSWGALRPGLLR